MAGAIGFKVPKDVKKLFFDRKKVSQFIDRRKAKFLAKFGAFTRRTAKSSIRSGGASGKVSMAGEPPRSQTGNLKKGILFFLDRKRGNVIIGPVLMSSLKGGAAALLTLEEGGSATIEEMNTVGGGRDAKGKFKPSRKMRTGKKIRKRIAARPFMKPAFEENKSKISSIWSSVNPN